MKSRILLGGLCLAVALVLSASPVWAQANLFTGKIGAGDTKVYTITTDTSAIIDIVATANHETTDLDIFAFRVPTVARQARIDDPDTDEDDVLAEDVLLRSEAGILQIEKGTISVGGATEVTICLTNVDGARSQFSALFTTPESAGVARGRFRARVVEIGAFGLDDELADPRLAAIQKLIRRHVEAKRQ